MDCCSKWGDEIKMSSGSDEDNPQKSGGQARRVSIINGRLDSKELFVGTREIVILHGSDEYHLRLTAQSKLILTK